AEDGAGVFARHALATLNHAEAGCKRASSIPDCAGANNKARQARCATIKNGLSPLPRTGSKKTEELPIEAGSSPTQPGAFDKTPAADFKSSFASKLASAAQLVFFGGPMSRVALLPNPIPRSYPALTRWAIALVVSTMALAAVSPAQDLAAFEKRVTVKTLPNGLTAIVCVRPHSAPVFSFY